MDKQIIHYETSIHGTPSGKTKCPLNRGAPWLEVGLGFVNN